LLPVDTFHLGKQRAVFIAKCRPQVAWIRKSKIRKLCHSSTQFMALVKRQWLSKVQPLLTLVLRQICQRNPVFRTKLWLN